MDNDEQLAQEIGEYQNLAKENKNVDVTALMLNALNRQTENQNLVSSKAKHWAYVISVGAPPFGLFFTAYYYFSEKEDAKHVAYVCAALTVVSVALLYFMGKAMFAGSGVNLQQLQNVKSADLQGLY